MARRYNCRCGKKRYRDEPAALAAAAADRAEYGGEVAVYRCTGGLAWHLSANGFIPEALRSVGRRLAYALLQAGEVDVDPGRQRTANRMIELGLAAPGSPGRLHTLDRAGLTRVIQIGLDAYAVEANTAGQ